MNTHPIIEMTERGDEHIAREQYGDMAVDTFLRAAGIDPEAGRVDPDVLDACARERYDAISALTRGTITPDECRAENRRLRAQYGDDIFESAAGRAVATHVRTFG